MYTEKSFEKSLIQIVQLFETEVLPSKNKILVINIEAFYNS